MQSAPFAGRVAVRSKGSSVVLAFASLCVLLGIAPPTLAHEVENTHVVISLSADGRYQVDILNDADWLWLRLTPTPAPLPPYAERARQLGEWTDRFRDGVTVMFDRQRVPVERVEYVPPATSDPSMPMGSGDPGLMRLTGTAPAGARTLQFAYRLVVDPFPLTIQLASGEPVTRWLMSDEPSQTVVLAELRPMTRFQVTRHYLGLGFTHIVPKGLDHILFVIGLFLLRPKLRALLLQVTAFTVAHTITLGLTIYGIFSLSSSIVEPLIALSIAYVAVENLVTSELKPWRVALVFAFGLLHGMGFAGVLANLGLPRSEFLTALMTFNLGVEVGQLSVIAMAFATVVAFRHKDWYHRRAVMPASMLIAGIGLYWTVQRVLGS